MWLFITVTLDELRLTHHYLFYFINYFIVTRERRSLDLNKRDTWRKVLAGSMHNMVWKGNEADDSDDEYSRSNYSRSVADEEEDDDDDVSLFLFFNCFFSIL